MAGQQSGNTKSVFFYGNIVVAAAFLIQLVSFGVQTAFGVFFKPVLADFGWTKAMTSGAFSLSWIISGLLGIAMGRLTDRFGPRGVITLCGIFLGLGYLLMSQLGTIWHLYLFYGVLIGIGMSGIWVSVMSTIARWFVGKTGVMSAIVMVGGGVGSLVAPPVSDWLISKYDWRTSYLILGGIVLAVVVLASQFLRREPPYTENRQEPKLETRGLSLREAVNTSQFWLFAGVIFCLGFCAYLVIVHIAPHAIELGNSTASAANILATVGGLAIVGRLVLGIAADRIGNRKVFIIGFGLTALALFWLLYAREQWALYLSAAVFGFGFGCGVANSPFVAELFGLSSHGLILGVNVLGYSIGAAFGPFLAGYIFDVTGSYQVAFLVGAIAGILGLTLAALITPIRGQRAK